MPTALFSFFFFFASFFFFFRSVYPKTRKMDFTYDELYNMNSTRVRYLRRQGDLPAPVAVFFLEIAHQVDQPADIYDHMYNLHREGDLDDIHFSIFEFIYTKGIITPKQLAIVEGIKDPSFRAWMKKEKIKMVKPRKRYARK